MPDLATSNLLVAIGTVLLNIGALKIIVALLMPNSWLGRMARAYSVRFGLLILFALTLVASVVTLYYSEYLGAVPCSWCWFQRVFLYPQVLLYATALWRKDYAVAFYTIPLSLVGSVIALYQHYLQMGGLDIVPCPATGSAADCALRTMFEFGYITYPFMALSLFVYLILFSYLIYSSEHKSRMAEGV